MEVGVISPDLSTVLLSSPSVDKLSPTADYSTEAQVRDTSTATITIDRAIAHPFRCWVSPKSSHRPVSRQHCEGPHPCVSNGRREGVPWTNYSIKAGGLRVKEGRKRGHLGTNRFLTNILLSKVKSFPPTSLVASYQTPHSTRHAESFYSQLAT